MYKKFFLIFVLYACCFQTAISQNRLQTITFAPHWRPQAQFAGYYMALDEGIYKKYGIDFKILPGGPDNPATALLKNNKADLASLWLTNAIEMREKGTKIVNITQLINHSALMLVAKKSSGIKSIKDLQGKRIGIWGGDFSIQPLSLIKKYNLEVKAIPQGGSVNLFLMGGVDVTSAMWYNEYHTILNSGVNENELTKFFFSDYGLNFPEEGIYCNEDFFINNKELCRKFIKATLEGWQLAFSHPDRAVNCVIKYIRANKNIASRSHEKWMLERMKELMFDKGTTDRFEKLSEKDYLFVGQKLKEYKLIRSIPQFKSFYKAEELN
jgi:NitT/TauT family transport system substrate-binding protein